MRSLKYLIVLLVVPVSISAGGVDRVDISTSTLVNLAEGHSGAFMGGAVSGDLFFSKSVGLRTTVGFTRSRYYPSDLNYSESDYGFWLSLAPVLQLDIGNRVKPYLAILGTFSGGSDRNQPTAPLNMSQPPFARLNRDARRWHAYSLGASIGSKLRLAGPVHLFGEVSHFFYTSISDQEVYFGPGDYFFDQEFDFERNPTYLSIGLTYSLDLMKR
jgi:hypothetical protein